jgi:DNA-binding MarR family transcriptional regulator
VTVVKLGVIGLPSKRLHIHGVMTDKIDSDELLSEVTGTCVAGRVLRAARLITRHYDDALRPTGLTITQFGLLHVIGRYEPDSISRVAELMNLDRTSLSRNLKPLEKAGYVHRGNEGTGRKRRVLLTTLGLKKLEEARPYWKAAQAKDGGCAGRHPSRQSDPEPCGKSDRYVLSS